MNPETTRLLTSIASAIIAAVLPLILKPPLEEAWNRHRQRPKGPPPLELPRGVRWPPHRPRLRTKWRLVILFSFVLATCAGILGYYRWGSRLAGVPFVLPEDTSLASSATASPTVSLSEATLTPPFTPASAPTPIARGELLMEIDFNRRGEGNCNDYDPGLLGYQNRMYYITPPLMNGYIAVCHENEVLAPEGSLQVTAFPEGTPSQSVYYGFGVLFGWKGGGLSTTDACIIGVRRRLGVAEAVFIERVGGHQSTFTQQLDWLILDNSPHTLRVVLQDDGVAYSYLDEHFLASHEFVQCSPGPVGLAAWGPGDLKVYFDDLKLFAP